MTSTLSNLRCGNPKNRFNPSSVSNSPRLLLLAIKAYSSLGLSSLGEITAEIYADAGTVIFLIFPSLHLYRIAQDVPIDGGIVTISHFTTPQRDFLK